MRFIIITGLSGSGKSTVTKEFEDMGYYCVENMPPALIPKFIELCSSANGKLENVALVADIRGGEDVFSALLGELSNLKNAGYEYEILFLEASDDSIVRRYKFSRRSHPLSEFGNILDGLDKERALLKNVKEHATYVVDTSELNLTDLHKKLRSLFDKPDGNQEMYITFQSFGFKYGVPIDCDLVFDVRFLPNPFHVEELREHTGEEACVQDYVMEFEPSKLFFDKLVDMISFLIPHFEEEGKPHLMVCIGCTGGRHRSVTLANKLFEFFSKERQNVTIKHRDILKDALRL
jgi:Predicted P-loop-containing kinase